MAKTHLKRLPAVLLWALLLMSVTARGQIANVAVAEAYLDQLVPKGETYFKARCYEKAMEVYLSTYWNKSSTRLCEPLLRRMAECALLSEMPRDTARFFIDQYLKMQPFDTEAHFLSAQAHYHGHDFERARKELNTFEQELADSVKLQKAMPWAPDKIAQLREWIDGAEALLAKPHCPWTFLNMGEGINTKCNELNPYIINDGASLVWSSDDRFDREHMINVFNVKWSDQTDLGWSPGKRIGGDMVNTPNDEYPSGPAPNGFFFCSNTKGDFALSQADYNGKGRCNNILDYIYPIDMQGSEVAGCLSPAGDTLYFSGTLANGKLDIFYSLKAFNGVWMEPRPVPGLINTQNYDENYPYLTPDGQRMYFASNRPGSMGGYDLYFADWDDDNQQWASPKQMPYPINDTYDNMTIAFSPTGRYAYTSQLRKDGIGCRDIYALIVRPEETTSVTVRFTAKLRGPDKKLGPLTGEPTIEMYDELKEKLWPIKMNMKNQSFVVNLEPGHYELRITLDGAHPYKEYLEVQDREYGPRPVERAVNLTSTALPEPKK